MDEYSQGGVDISGLHREIDALKAQLCRCRHEGTCVACQGFEMLRQQAQMVIAAASQPVLMQVAQEAAVKDLMAQFSGLGDKIAGDGEVQELMARLFERIQSDVGGPDELRKLLSMFGADSGTSATDHDVPPDDRPSRPQPQ